MSTFAKNFRWQERYLDQVESIIRANIGIIASVEIASDHDDMNYATDMVINISGGSVAVRLRRSNIRFRDWTIRSRNNGYKTELHKLREGYCDWYFYGWVTGARISEWILIDLSTVRDSGILTKSWTERSNGDGTYFIPVPLGVLKKHDCIVASQGIN